MKIYYFLLSLFFIISCTDEKEKTAVTQVNCVTDAQTHTDEDQSTEDQSTEDQSAQDDLKIINMPSDMNIATDMQTTVDMQIPVDTAQGRFDGIYIAAFQSEGIKTALSRLRIDQHQISGEIINRFGESFNLSGTVNTDGSLNIPTLMGSQGSQVTATGKISGNIVEGNYQSGDRSGQFAGSLDNVLTSKQSIDFDNFYEISFIRDDEEVASTILEVREGKFFVQVVNDDGMAFEGSGFVSEDGTFVLDNGKSAQFTIIAEAQLDVDSGKIQGLYSIGPKVGVIVGKRAD